MTDGEGSAPPPRDVRVAFGADGRPEPLPGGRGTAWRAGSIVLKPLDQPLAALEWQAASMPAVAAAVADLRVALPLRTASGALVVNGWTGWTLCAGRHEPGRWIEAMRAGDRLHRAFRDFARPAFLAVRDDPWAVADRAAWEAPSAVGSSDDRVARLRSCLTPFRESAQLVHGDLTGNVLFEHGQPPAVIDLSLYWRPTAYARAIVVADAIVWEGGPATLAANIHADRRRAGQLLARALLFRILADRPVAGPRGHRDPYQTAIELAIELATS